MTVQNINIFRPEWLNVVFANRNQAYGAYQLRKENARTTNMALLIALSFFVTSIAIPTVISKMSSPLSAPSIDNQHQIIIDLQKIYKVITPQKATQQPAKQATAKPINNMVKNLPPVVAPNATNEPPTQTQLQHADSGPVTMQGTHSDATAPVDAKPGTTNTTGANTGTTATGDGNEVFPIAEFNPEYPGGEAAFTRFLQKNIRYPQIAKENGIQGKVYIQFIVERDGNLSDIKILKEPGYGTGDEAVRVLKMSPRWKPGSQNGNTVRVQYTVPVNFSLNDGN